MPAGRSTQDGDDQSIQALLDQLLDDKQGGEPVRPTPAPTIVEAIPSRRAVVTGPRPWVSASASLALWGSGQWLNGQRSLGMLFFLLQALAAAWIYCLAMTWESWVWLAELFSVPEASLQTAAAGAGLAIPLIGVGCVAQAFLYPPSGPGGRGMERNRLLPGVASVLVPGWGQLLNGHTVKAFLFLTTWAVGLYLLAISRLQPTLWARIDPGRRPLAGLQISNGMAAIMGVVGVLWVIAVYDALVTGRRRDP